MQANNPELGPNTLAPFVPEAIPQPVDVRPGEIVENVFSEGGVLGASADRASIPVTEQYLKERHNPQDPGSDTLVIHQVVPGRSILPRIRRVPNGTKERVVGIRRTEDYWVSKRVAAAVTGGSLLLCALVNAGSIVGDIGDEIGQGVHKIARLFHPLKPYYVTTISEHEEPGPLERISMDVSSRSPSGKVALDKAKIGRFTQEIADKVAAGGTVVKGESTGSSSDDYGSSDNRIGIAESPWQDLADERAIAAAKALKLAAQKQGIDLPKNFKIIIDQDVLTPAEKKEALSLAQADGFPTIMNALNAVQRGEVVNADLKKFMFKQFVTQRGTELSVDMKMPGKPIKVATITPHEVTPTDQVPVDKDRDYIFFGIILPPIRRRELIHGVKQAYKWVVGRVPKPKLIPILVENMRDRAWVRLRKTALNEDHTLKDAPWQFARKFMHLFRENSSLDEGKLDESTYVSRSAEISASAEGVDDPDAVKSAVIEAIATSEDAAEECAYEDSKSEITSRIPAVLRADYEMANGELSSLRTMFVDHMPKPEVLEAFGMLMKMLTAMQGGRLGLKLPDIFVYPSSSAGLEHNDPRKIGIGVDEQEPIVVLGECTPLLGLVEIHMRTDITDVEGLLTELYKFVGPLWTMAHEWAGHGTDTIEGKQTLLSVQANGVENAYFPLGTAWRDGLGATGQALEPLLGRDTEANPVIFEATFDLKEGYGNSVTPTMILRGDNPMLSFARRLRIVGFDPTVYAGTNAAEQCAETAAAETTNIPIDGAEAGVDLRPQTADNGESAAFATGYSPDAASAEEFRRRVGANLGVEPLTFANLPRVTLALTTADADPKLAKMIKEARELNMPLPDDMMAILAELRR